MNEEQYVTFDVAKLLKEKGFDWKTDFVWYEHLPLSLDWRNKANQKAMDYFYFNETTEHQSYYRNCDKKPSYINGDIYSAPTQQMACRWLRKEKGIHILPEISEVKENPKYYCMIWKTSTLESFIIELFDSYEDAIEAALEYVLKNLI